MRNERIFMQVTCMLMIIYNNKMILVFENYLNSLYQSSKGTEALDNSFNIPSLTQVH